MPWIQNELLPKYQDQGLFVIAVHKGTRIGPLSTKLVEWGVTLPVALDFDSEVFRRWRKPDWVFPLNAVVGRDGKVAYFDGELELDGVEAAIVAALEQ